MDIDKFKQANFSPRTAKVPVPQLKDFFAGVPELIVRGLTGQEVAKARERVNQNSMLRELVDKILSDKASSKAEGLQQALGITDDVPSDLVYRIAVCEFGINSVHFEQEDCVKLATVVPEHFYEISSKILELTGLGQAPPGGSNAS